MVVDPSKARARWALPLLKVLPGQRFNVQLAGERWWFFGSHWLERLYLCVGEGCEGCVFGMPRVMGYRVAYLQTPESRRTVLLEAPVSSVAKFESLAAMEGLSADSGAFLCLTRKHRRCAVAMEPVDEGGCVEAKPLSDVCTINALALIFALPQTEAGEIPRAWADRVKSIAHARLVAALAKVK